MDPRICKLEKSIEDLTEDIKDKEKELKTTEDDNEKDYLRLTLTALRQTLQSREAQMVELLKQETGSNQHRMETGGRSLLHPNSASPTASMERMMNEIGQIHQATVKTDRATPQYSPAHVGNLEKDRLMKDNRFKGFQGNAGDARVLSEEQLIELSTTDNEHQVVAYLTPYLEDIVKDTISGAVFNSEEYKWIETSSETTVYNDKPDLIICHPAIINARPPFKCEKDAKLTSMRRSGDKFGVLSQWRLRNFIGLTCEAKQRVCNEGFGQVINYGKHICFGKHGAVTTRLILFDKKEFWLVDTVRGTVSSVHTCGWTVEGSRSLLREFVHQPPLAKVLCEACQHYNLRVGTDSFLGAGAFGYVFRAHRETDGKEIALKITVNQGTSGAVERLESEKEKMIVAKEKCPEHVVGVEEDGFKVFTDGAVLLLSSVGEHYSKLAPQDIVNSLDVLHSNGILHGDPRLENVVCVDGKAHWIDFAACSLVCGQMSRDSERNLLLSRVQESFKYTPSPI